MLGRPTLHSLFATAESSDPRMERNSTTMPYFSLNFLVTSWRNLGMPRFVPNTTLPSFFALASTSSHFFESAAPTLEAKKTPKTPARNQE